MEHVDRARPYRLKAGTKRVIEGGVLKDPPSVSWLLLGILLREFMTSITNLCLARVTADWMGILDPPLTPSTPYQDSE